MFGKYASFIIPAYLISALVILALIMFIKLRHKQLLAELSRFKKRSSEKQLSKKSASISRKSRKPVTGKKKA